MSKKSLTGPAAAKAFFDQLMDEPGNQSAVQADLVRMAADRGFDCTIDELTEALKELWGDPTNLFRYSERPGF